MNVVTWTDDRNKSCLAKYILLKFKEVRGQTGFTFRHILNIICREDMSSKSPKEPLPYWLVNVPKSQWPSECPAFLADQSQRNRDLLSIPDTEYKLQTWDEIKEIIQNNDLQRFQRVPSELRRYLEFLAELKAIWGSVMQFVLTRRLGWTSTDPAGRPFEHARE